jgi:hypothetical protein
MALPNAVDRWAIQGSVRVARRWFSFWNPTYDVSVGGAQLGVLVRTPNASAYSWLLRDRSGANIATLVPVHPNRHYHLAVRQATDLGSIRQSFRPALTGTVSELSVVDPDLKSRLRSSPALLGSEGPVSLLDEAGRLAGFLGPTTGAALELFKPLDMRLAMALLASRIEARERLTANPQWLTAGDSCSR